MYASVADMLSRFGEQDLILLTDREGRAESIDNNVLEQALNDASAEIDGYLAGRYPLPLAHVPTILNRLCCDIARYSLSTEHAPEPVEKRYQAALRFLTSVGKGELQLGLSDDGEAAPSSNFAEMQSDGRVFSRSDKGFI